MKKKRAEKDDGKPAKKDPIRVVAASCTCGWARSGDDWPEVASAAASHRMLHAISMKQAGRL